MTRRNPQILFIAISLTLSGASLWRYARAQPFAEKNATTSMSSNEQAKKASLNQRSRTPDEDRKFSHRPGSHFGGLYFEDDPLGFEEIRLGIAIDRMSNAEGDSARH